MFRLKSTIQKDDGTQILPVLSELLLNGGNMVQFRSRQPGYVGHSKEISSDGVQFIVTMDFETEEDYNACLAAELADIKEAERVTNFNNYLAENGVTITRETLTV